MLIAEVHSHCELGVAEESSQALAEIIRWQWRLSVMLQWWWWCHDELSRPRVTRDNEAAVRVLQWSLNLRESCPASDQLGLGLFTGPRPPRSDSSLLMAETSTEWLWSPTTIITQGENWKITSCSRQHPQCHSWTIYTVIFLCVIVKYPMLNSLPPTFPFNVKVDFKTTEFRIMCLNR